jgi:hypothetical protein
MPPTPKKLVQTKLSFHPVAGPSSSSSSTTSSSVSSSTPLLPSNRRTGARPGNFRHRQWIREDSAEHKEWSNIQHKQWIRREDSSDWTASDKDDGPKRELKWKPPGARYNKTRADIAKETM